MLDHRGFSSNEAWLMSPMATACFWAAIVLPVLYMPLLAIGIDTQSKGLIFAVLLFANSVALLGGHSHRAE